MLFDNSPKASIFAINELGSLVSKPITSWLILSYPIDGWFYLRDRDMS